MPLAVLCGLPASGKSEIARQLHQAGEAAGMRVATISDSLFISDKNFAHTDVSAEKNLRASLKSAVQRELASVDLLLLDSGNYLKSFRYELHCSTLAAQTTQCLLYCEVAEEEALKRNVGRPVEEQYREEVMRALIMRFEPPVAKNRWDSPLITVSRDHLNCEEIISALLSRTPARPNMATVAQPVQDTDCLSNLEQMTQRLTREVIAALKFQQQSVKFSSGGEALVLRRPVTAAELHRWRRQFVAMMRGKNRPVEGGALEEVFTHYLQSCLDNG